MHSIPEKRRRDTLRTLKIKPRAHGDMENHETHIDRRQNARRRYGVLVPLKE